MAEVSRRDFDRAFDVWVQHHRLIAGHPRFGRQTFNDFIGAVPLYHKATKSHTLPDDAARIIAMLLSPHASTLLRVYLIQHGLDETSVEAS